MKKLSALLLAVCFVLGSLSSAAAVDVKVKGNWQFSYGYFGNYSFYDGGKGPDNKMDPFQARMRSRTQVEFIASETLRSVLQFEIGVQNFGQSGFTALDADGKDIKVKHAFIDWTIPGTKTSLRMGVQPMKMPGLIAGNFVYNNDIAGVMASTEFSPEVALTAFWARPYDAFPTVDAGNVYDERGNRIQKKKRFDEMDLFGFTLPVKTQFVRLTPWAMIGSVGADSGYYNSNYNIAYAQGYDVANRYGQSLIWWAGLSFELPTLDPFIVQFDGMYGSLSGKDNRGTSGYYLALLLGYKWNWGTTSLVGWYGSGDDGEFGKDDMGRIPVVSADGGFEMGTRGFAGNRALSRAYGISGLGSGTWGLGIRIDNVSFTENLTHGFRAYYVRGTNSGERIGPDSPVYLSTGNKGISASPDHYAYLISTDSAWDFALTNTYKISDNFNIGLDFSYTQLNLSKQRSSQWEDTTGAYAGVLSFQYTF